MVDLYHCSKQSVCGGVSLTWYKIHVIFLRMMSLDGKLLHSLIVMLAVLMVSLPISYADIYRYIDENGVIHFTNTPSGEGYKKILSVDKDVNWAPHKIRGLARGSDYHQIILSKAQKYKVEPSLIKAVIKAESNFDPIAISPKGAMGLMQLMPYTARQMDVRNPFEPEENIEAGVRYLKYLLDKFDGNLTLALAAYNAGADTVERAGGIPPIQETRQYIRRVLSLCKGKCQTSASGRPSTNKSDILYRVIYEDRTVLYTNTPFAYPDASRF